jgi:photosystem I P700 chlorophyll a apoprotein A1
MRALGRPQDMSLTSNSFTTYFAQWIQNIHLLAWNNCSKCFSNNKLCGGVVEVGGKIAMMPIQLGTADFMVHHIHAFTIHVTVLILLKGVLYARSSKLIRIKLT